MGESVLQIWDVAWLLDEAQCPCDIHFVEWLVENGISGASIFHFGTGAHHHVGLDNHSRGAPNTILGITASPKEFEAFVTLAITHPELSRNYQVLFGDIYLLNARLLPRLDIVSLFHLCEFRGDSQDAYGGLSDRQVIELLLEVMPAGGRMLLFSGSFAYDKADAIAEKLVRDGRLVRDGDHKSLVIYRKRALTGSRPR
jgi:hypothetical protein